MRGYDGAAVQAVQATLAGLTQAAAAHEAARAAAQRATAERDAAGQALDGWWGEFRAVARVALKGRSDLLGALGM
jgi:RecB family exonuclease